MRIPEEKLDQTVSGLCHGLVNTLTRLLPAALLLFSVVFLLQYLVIALLRIGYPYEIEWLEGACLTHVLRLINGQGIYVPPGVDFIPYLYTPLYFELATWFVRVFGVSFFSTRLLSFLCSLGLFALLYLWGRRESRDWKGGLLTIGLFAAMFRWTGAWLDLGRVDSLFLLFLVGGAMRLRFASHPRHDLVAAACFLLAFMTKQTALPVAMGFALYLALTRSGLGRVRFALFFLAGVVGYWAFQHLRTDGWFTYYVFKMPKGHGLLWSGLTRFWTKNIFLHIPILFANLCLWVLLVHRHEGWRRFLFAACWAGTMFLITLLSRLRHGGYDNVFLPLAIVTALASAVLLIREKNPGLQIAVLLQFFMLLYNPVAQIPTAADRAANDAIVAYLRSVPGPVFCPQHSMLAWQAGKKSFHVHDTTFFDFTRAYAGDDIDQMMVDDLRGQRWEVIVLATKWFPQYLSRTYQQIDPPFPVNEHGYTRTGVRSRPKYVYVKRVQGADGTSTSKSAPLTRSGP